MGNDVANTAAPMSTGRSVALHLILVPDLGLANKIKDKAGTLRLQDSLAITKALDKGDVESLKMMARTGVRLAPGAEGKHNLFGNIRPPAYIVGKPVDVRQTASVLLQLGADINYPAEQGGTALASAAYNNDSELGLMRLTSKVPQSFQGGYQGKRFEISAP